MLFILGCNTFTEVWKNYKHKNKLSRNETIRWSLLGMQTLGQNALDAGSGGLRGWYEWKRVQHEKMDQSSVHGHVTDLITDVAPPTDLGKNLDIMVFLNFRTRCIHSFLDK